MLSKVYNQGNIKTLKDLKGDTAMTIKDFINQAVDLAMEALRRDDHEAYRKCIAIIADAIYEDLEAKEFETLEIIK